MISYYLKDFGNLTGNGQPITGLEADTTYNIVVNLTNDAMPISREYSCIGTGMVQDYHVS